jgi:hypothetical protein
MDGDGDAERDRLDRALASLDGRPLNAYEVSLRLFRRDLPGPQRRFAVAEALSHLVRLVGEGRAARVDGGFVAA